MPRMVLDYSDRPGPDPARIAAGYGGVIRYLGSPGVHAKELTGPEAVALAAHHVPVALVCELGANWMLGGYRTGVDAMSDVFDDAQTIGQPFRCCYLACDFDVTNTSQMSTVSQCIRGALSISRNKQVGIYGEYDVIEAMFRIFGDALHYWQTKAWSAGKISAHADALQLIGSAVLLDTTSHPVTCDLNGVLAPDGDWGQFPYTPPTQEMTVTPEDKTWISTQLDALRQDIDNNIHTVAKGDNDNPAGPEHHPDNLQEINAKLDRILAQLPGGTE